MSNKPHPHYAFPGFADLEVVMRFGSVKRWHMLDTVRVQTLAEHSANTALLTYHIAMTAPQMYFGPSANVALGALLHDVDEVFTGDIPTPTKRHFAAALKDLEDKLTPFQYGYACSADTGTLIKVCDLAEGMRFIRLYGGGSTINRHAESGIQRQFHDRLEFAVNSLKWPIEVLTHVFGKAWFYAYETGDYFKESTVRAHERKVGSHVA